LWGSLILALALITGLLLTFMAPAPEPVTAQESKQANIIVQLDDQALLAREINFSSPISGLKALALSGLDVVTTATNFGPAVCSIEGVGCPATNCFCDANRFWAYSYWDGSEWQSYPVGAGSSVISETGAIEGWRWGEFGAPQTPATVTVAAVNALTWLQSRQTITDGGYGSVGAAVETMLAIGANHEFAAAWRRNTTGASLADYVAVNGALYTRSSAGAGKLAVALAATNACLPAGALTPQAHYSPTLGAYNKQSGPNSWALLGTVAISESVPATAVTTLKAQAQPSGGWEWSPTWGADTNTTALALQALLAAGEPVSATAVMSGLAFLQAAQQADGGFAYDLTPGAQSDANSTAYSVQALLAAGEDPTGPRWTISNTNPIRYLLSLQLPDGSLVWQPATGANQLATQQAIPALLGRAHPVRRQAVEACPALYLPLVKR
jgi:hypothetical protein